MQKAHRLVALSGLLFVLIGASAQADVTIGQFNGGVAEPGDPLEVLVGGPVGEVDPGDVHPGSEDGFEGGGVVGGRAEGGDDLGAAHGRTGP